MTYWKPQPCASAPDRRESSIRRVARALLIGFYLVAGIAHLSIPGGFVAITPRWVPDPQGVVFLTGIAELMGAIGVAIPPSRVPHVRRAAAIGLALYALCVWPANFHHAFADIPLGGRHFGWWYHAPRLALQPLVIWWPLWAAGVIDRPFGKAAS